VGCEKWPRKVRGHLFQWAEHERQGEPMVDVDTSRQYLYGNKGIL
jgi:hypothetical protein